MIRLRSCAWLCDHCSDEPKSSNAASEAPDACRVLRLAGNVIVIGTDPSKHAQRIFDTSATAIGARDLVGAGIGYAAGGTDGGGNAVTGAYISLSQYFYFSVRSLRMQLPHGLCIAVNRGGRL